MDELRKASFPFPVADADDGPDIRFSDAVLTLTFVDCTGRRCTVRFIDTVWFSYTPIESDDRRLDDVGVFSVGNSSLISRLIGGGELERDGNYTHQIICFNERGCRLEVVFEKIETDDAA